MGESTKIAWTDHTFNPWWGCQRVSPGCEHCYAETFAKRVGLKVWGPQSERRFFGDKHWAEPLAWNRKAAAEGRRARVFCASMADVFEDRADLVEHRARLWRLVGDTPHLDWLLLTKRPENAAPLARQAALLAWDGGGPDLPTWPSNVWLGTTCEDQRRADERLPHLLGVPAAVRFVSYEPALGPVDFTRWVFDRDAAVRRAMRGPAALNREQADDVIAHPLDWVIVGGESGTGARPFDAAWARETVAQCKSEGVACFVKQMGSRPYDSNVNASDWPDSTRFGELPKGVAATVAGAGVKLAHSKGEDPAEWPEDLRVREWPGVRHG